MRNLCKCGCGRKVSKPGNVFINGHNRKGIHHTEESKRKIRKSTKGKNNHFYGKYHTKETRKRMRKSHIGIPLSDGHKRSLSKAGKGRIQSKETRKKRSKTTTELYQNPIYGERLRKEKSDTQKKLWQNPKYAKKQLKAVFAGLELRPTKPERRLRNRLNKLFPGEYGYVGDGSVLIGYKNPDFININNQKKIIELFGDYWHGKERTGRTRRQEENQRIKHFSKYGYKTLIVWEHELINILRLKKKLKDFHNE